MISYFVRINADLNKKIRIGPFPKLTDLLRSVWIREGEGLREWSVLISSRGERVNSFGACEMTSLARYAAKTAVAHALSLLVSKKPRCYDSLFMFVGILAAQPGCPLKQIETIKLWTFGDEWVGSMSV